MTITPTDVRRARRLYGNDPYLIREYLRAISVVRRSRNGWLLDQLSLTVGTHALVNRHE